MKLYGLGHQRDPGLTQCRAIATHDGQRSSPIEQSIVNLVGNKLPWKGTDDSDMRWQTQPGQLTSLARQAASVCQVP